MLDTNICIFAMRNKPPIVMQRLLNQNPEDICISSITLSELLYGVEKSKDADKNWIALSLFLSPITILDYDSSAAQAYGKIRAELEKKGTPIGPNDLLIAAHAYSKNLVVVTNNTREFTRVPGLIVEDWSALSSS